MQHVGRMNRTAYQKIMVTDFSGRCFADDLLRERFFCPRIGERDGKVISISRETRGIIATVHASSRKFQARVDKTFRTVISYVPGSLASYTGQLIDFFV